MTMGRRRREGRQYMWYLRQQRTTLDERVGNERALETVRAVAPDMQTPAFWRSVWEKP